MTYPHENCEWDLWITQIDWKLFLERELAFEFESVKGNTHWQRMMLMHKKNCTLCYQGMSTCTVTGSLLVSSWVDPSEHIRIHHCPISWLRCMLTLQKSSDCITFPTPINAFCLLYLDNLTPCATDVIVTHQVMIHSATLATAKYSTYLYSIPSPTQGVILSRKSNPSGAYLKKSREKMLKAKIALVWFLRFFLKIHFYQSLCAMCFGTGDNLLHMLFLFSQPEVFVLNPGTKPHIPPSTWFLQALGTLEQTVNGIFYL